MKGVIAFFIVMFLAFLYATRDVDWATRKARPALQTEFVSIVEEARTRSTGAHDALRDSLFRDRNEAICKLLDSMEVNEWVGQVEGLKRLSDGRIELTVRIGRSLSLINRNTAIVFGGGARNWIEVGSPVYASLLEIEKYQRIRFSGTFMEDRRDCIRATRKNLRDSLYMPEFIFRFSHVEAL